MSTPFENGAGFAFNNDFSVDPNYVPAFVKYTIKIDTPGPTGGLVVAGDTNFPPTKTVIPLTLAQTGLGIANPFKLDPYNCFSLEDNNTVVIKYPGIYNIGISIGAFSPILGAGMLAQVLPASSLGIFTAQGAAVVGAAVSVDVTDTPIFPVYSALMAAHGENTIHVIFPPQKIQLNYVFRAIGNFEIIAETSLTITKVN